MSLTQAQQLKFRLLANGLSVSLAATRALHESLGDSEWTSADYASTSGLILCLEDHVWVNAPIKKFNPNFVGSTPYVLDRAGSGFVVHGAGLESSASYWPQPAYHGSIGLYGGWNDYVFTHADRARLSPILGCSMTCKFCNIPYEDRYRTKPVKPLVDALRCALEDPLQPARHILISGGTPSLRDVEFLREVYRTVLREFPEVDVDIMMVPVGGLLNLDELDRLGVHQLSVNLEIYSEGVARKLMPNKHRQGLGMYLDFIEDAASVLGQGRVRSMLMVGLEPLSETLRGVQALLERGGVPVLSPFRPDPATPLATMRPPSAADLEDVFLRATDLADTAGAELGPSCGPCTHNTLTLPRAHVGLAPPGHVSPHLI